MLRLFLCLGLISLVFGGIPSSTKLSASIRDIDVNGIEGFNFNVVAPFKFQEYVVGFRYALGNSRKTPVSLFVKRDFETPGDGIATLNADYDLGDNSLNIATRWNSDALGLTVDADGDTKRRLRTVGLSKSLKLNGNQLTVSAVYDVLKKNVLGGALLDADGTRVEVKCDSENRDPLLAVTRALDEKNEISPAIKLRTGEISYGYRRKWNGGSLFSRYFPGDKLTLEWQDQGGSWTTTAEVPLADSTSTKVSFSRDWNY